MAKPVITYRSSVYSSTNSSPYTASPTWTPAANSLIVAFVVGCAVSPADPTGVTAHGVTLAKIPLSANSLSTTHLCSIWVGNAGASPTSTACVATFGGSPTGGVIIEFEISGWESDEDPINAFGKGTLIKTATGTATSGTVTFDLHADVTGEHVEMSFWLHLANEATTFRTNWTETAGADGNFNTPATGAEAQFRTDAFELTASASWTSSVLWRGYGLVVRGAVTTPTDTLKLADGPVSARLNPQPVLVGQEGLKIADAVITPPLAQAVPDEVFKIDAVNEGVVQLIGVLHVQDQLTQPVLVSGGGDLSRAVTDENLELGDGPVSPRLNPQPVLVADEALKVADTVQATASLSRAVPDEVFKIDGVNEGVVQLIGVLHIQDQLTQPVLTGGPVDLGVRVRGTESSPLAALV